MFEDRPVPSEPEPDASDVVEGPVGSASLRDPATSGPMGADLEALPSIEVDPEAETNERPSVERTAIDRRSAPHDRQDTDHVGTDWDLTRSPDVEPEDGPSQP